ncbi:hypothetical protein FYZ44_05775 [Mobiluncus mulieris]|nr:hypothetical protein [Mobiluncus mulieris]
MGFLDWIWTGKEYRMFSAEQRRVAIELFIKYDYSAMAIIRKLGYPSPNSRRECGHLGWVGISPIIRLA